MKKIAIMTWFHYYNFGTSLQVTALSHAIERLGYQANVIQYIPHGKIVTLRDYKNPIFYIKELQKKIINAKNQQIINNKRKKAFDDFLNTNINLTSSCTTDSELFALNQQFDAFVCGSDQIWAPSCFNPKYFLNFVEDSDKMISYAPSLGLPTIQDGYIRQRMKECIERFKFLSVREEQGKNLIKEICNKDAEVVLDPTLLLSDYEWDKMAAKRKVENPYVLCYFLGNNKESWQHVSKISAKMRLSIKIIPIFAQDLERGFDVALDIGPADFLGLVKNASLICTDSFHGTVFSILYQRPFYTYERFSNRDRNSQNSRIYNILKIAGLEDRLIKDKILICDSPLTCDFKNTKYRLEKEKEESIRYLKNALIASTAFVEKSHIRPYQITNTCCGCGACTAVCRQEAIKVTRNEDGFLAAYIDVNKCIRCGICSKVCPYNGIRSVEIDRNIHNLFMVRSKDSKVLQKSSSGGIGYELSQLLSKQEYDVVGCVYNNKIAEAEHQFVPAIESDKLHIFQGSKYLQSNSEIVFKNLLNISTKAVIFGTPCQISGIDRVLKLRKKRNDFILIDLICHGVPTQNLWQKYLREGNKKHGFGQEPIVDFRDKPKGWRNRYIRIKGNGKTYSCLDKKDMFYRFFLSGHCFMPACYECGYRTASAADIRIGDYWGPRYVKVKDGASMVIVLSNAGERVLQQLKEAQRIELQRMNCEEYWTVQYPENPIKPVFYKELMDGLKDNSVILQTLFSQYGKGFEICKKLYKPYSMFRRTYQMLRNKK